MNKLVGIQWGRGIAAMLVVICHSIAHPFPSAPDIAHMMGRVGVTMFFIISGYIMVTTTSRDDGRFDPLQFMGKRIARIVPLYYGVTLLVALLTLVAPAIFKSTPFDLGHIVTSLLFIPTYTPEPPHSIEPFYKLGWTLNYEMFFYAVFACLCWMRTRARTITLIVLFAGLFLLGLLIPFENAAWVMYTRTDILAFAAGAAIATFKPQGAWRLSPTAQVAIVLGGVLLMAMMLPAYGANRATVWVQIVAMIACLGFVIVLACHDEARDTSAGRTAMLLGDASYAIYLFHMFAVAGTWLVAERLLGEVSPVAFVAVAAFSTVTAAMLGISIHRYCERPIARMIAPRPAPA
jgi:exopolysaccharide production protein ExoZ